MGQCKDPLANIKKSVVSVYQNVIFSRTNRMMICQ